MALVTLSSSSSTPASPQAAISDPNANRRDISGNLLSSNPANTPNPSAAPTSGSQVPTKAPSVFSSTQATDAINQQVVPAMNKGLGDIALQNARVAGDPYAYLPGDTPDSYNKRISAYNDSKNPSTATPPPSPSDQAASDIANTPDVGHQFAYDNQGNKVQVPQGSNAPDGYSFTKPSNPVINKTPVTASVATQSGNTLQQYQDGTYGQVDASGNYLGPVTQAAFSTAQSNDPKAVAASIATSLLSVINGSYPLTDVQQAQINGLNQSFSSQIATQAQANANLTGATTVAENLYGMGNSIAGLGIIKGTVDSGVSKITDLQAKQASAVADMESKFKADDMTGLKTAYDIYSKAADDIQTNINNLRDYAEKVKVDNATIAHNNFQEALDSKNLTLTEKRDAFTQYIQSADLDERQRNDAVTQFQNQEKIDQDQQKILQDSKGTTDTQRATAAVSSLQSLVTSGAPLKDGTPVLDSDGHMTPEAWKSLINEAPSEGLDRNDFINAFSHYIATDDGKVSAAYGLTPAELKLVGAS